jgi:hypothetical protein
MSALFFLLQQTICSHFTNRTHQHKNPSQNTHTHKRRGIFLKTTTANCSIFKERKCESPPAAISARTTNASRTKLSSRAFFKVGSSGRMYLVPNTIPRLRVGGIHKDLDCPKIRLLPPSPSPCPLILLLLLLFLELCSQQAKSSDGKSPRKKTNAEQFTKQRALWSERSHHSLCNLKKPLICM